MKKKCECCGIEYDVQNSDSFFRFQFCSDKCEQQSNQRIKQLDMYVCFQPLPITIVETKKQVTVRDGSKWQRDEGKTRGLCAVHLENLSGNIHEELHWIEIDERLLKEHFQKIN